MEDVRRATVYGNAFIPPQPIEPDTSRPGDAYGPSFGSLAARRPEEALPPAMPVSGGGLNLKPPVPGGGNTFHKKRTPSLFERFTSPLRGSAEEIQSAPVAAPAPAAHAPIPQQRTVQDSLAIELRRAEAADDQLDIPAFLRRQAN